MSNYNLVIDTSNFKPFDIGPALQVLHDYRDAYYKYEDLMNKIAEEKGLYILPDTPENHEYRGVMDRYNADYDAAVEDFSRGMNLANANMIRDIRRRYFNEVTPINKAIEAYNKDLDKMTALGADAIIANLKRSIRDYYGGLNPGIRYLSDKAILATAANVMLGLNNALMSAPELAGSIANLYFKLKQEGINGEKALNTILKINPQLNSQEGISDTSQLLDALDRVYLNYAFENGTPENEKIWKSVVSGALQGIQAPKYDLKADLNFENAATRAQRLHAEAATEHTIETTRHLRNLMALEEAENNLLFGRIYNPKTGKYEEDWNLAAKILKLRSAGKANNTTNPGKNSDAVTPAPPAPPSGTAKMTYNFKDYYVKEGSTPRSNLYYRLNEETNKWELLPVGEHVLKKELENEYRRQTRVPVAGSGLNGAPFKPKDDAKDNGWGVNRGSGSDKTGKRSITD